MRIIITLLFLMVIVGAMMIVVPTLHSADGGGNETVETTTAPAVPPKPQALLVSEKAHRSFVSVRYVLDTRTGICLIISGDSYPSGVETECTQRVLALFPKNELPEEFK